MNKDSANSFDQKKWEYSVKRLETIKDTLKKCYERLEQISDPKLKSIQMLFIDRLRDESKQIINNYPSLIDHK